MKPEERIIETCLEEILGGASAPDLTRQILSRWHDASVRESSVHESSVHESSVHDGAPSDESPSQSHPADRIIDACLEEMLGDARPPQLTDHVVRQLEAMEGEFAPMQSAPLARQFEPTAPPLPEETTVDPAAPPLPSEALKQSTGHRGALESSTPAVRARRRSRGPRGSRRMVSVLATLSAALLLVAGVYWQVNHGQPNQVVTQAGGQDPISETNNPPNRKKSDSDSAAGGAEPKSKGTSPKGSGEISLAPFEDPLFPTGELFVGPAQSEDENIEEPRQFDSSDRLSDEEIVHEMNQMLAQSWREAGVTTAPATDEQWCRRIYLQMLGRIPSVGELEGFASDDRLDRRTRLIDLLQEGEGYADEYAAHWASFWGTVLVGRRGGMGADDTASREDLEIYLAEAITNNVPYDQLASELIVAIGSGRPGSKDYNPATNFLLASMDNGGDKKGLLATTRTFQVFHGRQVKCIQCHAHPSNKSWTQKQFWSLNAFFRQMKMRRGGGGPALIDQDFVGEGPGGIDEAELFFEQLNGETVAALPEYPGRGAILPNGRVSVVRRREQLAELMTEDPQLARAAINRIWHHFHGFGFTRPVDDMGPHNPVSHPELLDLLANQFAGDGYRLDRLVRWIAASDGFNRSSQVTQATAMDSPEAGSRPLFSRYYTRQLQPEAVYDSLRLVADTKSRDKSLEGRAKWLGQFIQPMGTDEGQELSTFGGDVNQSLIIMNGPLMRKATNSRNQDGLLHRVIQSNMSLEDKVEHLFMASVARKPTRRELSAVNDLRASQSNAAEVLESVWWALLNSNEFILDH